MTSLMQQEIFSEPEMLKRTVAACSPVLPQIKKAFEEKGITNIITMARGTSDNAATVFSFVCPLYSGMKVGKYHPSLTTVYDADVDMKHTCMVIVSQSGMSKDTIAVLRKAKKLGAMTIGVTNNKESDTAKECDFHLFLDVEEEKSVAATKTYIAELIALYMLTTVVGKPCDTKKNFTTLTTLSSSPAEQCWERATSVLSNLPSAAICSTAPTLLPTLCMVRSPFLQKAQT